MRITGDTFEQVDLFSDGEFRLVLADPPYNFGFEDKRYLHNHFCRIAECVIVFSPPENQWVLPADQYLFWQKPISTKNTSKTYARFVEMIFVYGRAAWNHERHWSQYNNIFDDLVDDTSLHPFRKPPSLIERLILNHTDPGDYILDPFAGSHVVEDVGLRHGRKVVSIEVEQATRR
jgi:DNA modification methylase